MRKSIKCRKAINLNLPKTKDESQDGGFLPLLLGALGSLAAPVLGSLFS